MHETEAMEGLLQFAQEYGLLAHADVCFARNALLYAMRLNAPTLCGVPAPGQVPPTATPFLNALCDSAVSSGLIADTNEDRDGFSAHLMNLVTAMPSAVAERFSRLWEGQGIPAATDWFYDFCRRSDYIRVDALSHNIEFIAPSKYGDLEITINLSKPEKDPTEIARLKDAPKVDYPKCMLCVENEGYAGRPGYPSHETLRMIQLSMSGERWWFQYSPYSYYNEHCIVLNDRHTPMTIDMRTLERLFDFVDQFPHYFIGSNADLPIVGGSILTHEHFQGGAHQFPMDRARVTARFAHPAYPTVRVESVHWPVTCLRLTADSRAPLLALAGQIMDTWRRYDDPAHDILHSTEGQPHNTITPIARILEGGEHQLQLVLRNNRTTPDHPLGLFHPHADLHHIKRENIGLIEVMGLFILPGRLEVELDNLAAVLTGEYKLELLLQSSTMAKHHAWAEQLVSEYGTSLPKEGAKDAIRAALTKKCERILEDAGVFKLTDSGALKAFLSACGIDA